jgi:hypothetical protein
MEVKPLEVYAEDSNYGVVRMPARNFPGCVIQGDSLAILYAEARRVVECVRTGATGGEECLGAVEKLHNALLDRLLHYHQLLRRQGLSLPYGRSVTEGFVRLGPGEGERGGTLP